MGFPGHTVDLPCVRPDLAAAVARARFDPEGRREELLAHLGGRGGSGHLTASAWVLDAMADRVLLVRHSALGWACPGGHLDADESTAAAASRELAEETGLDALPAVPDAVLLHVAWFPRPSPHQHWGLGHLFLVDPEAHRLVGEPGAPARWFPVTRLPLDTPADLAPSLALVMSLVGAGPDQ